MRHDLFDYQRTAALDILKRLSLSQLLWDDHQARSSFALSAVTGSGKTVIATAVIEATVHGSSDLQTEAQPQVSFLWVTDDPALNNQTRARMLASSDLLQPRELVILDNDFLDDELSPGRVYFLNIQKLSKRSGLAHGGQNLREHSMWEILAHTINRGNVDLHLVLDEAHRGMKTAQDRRTIVQRLISGQAGSNPAVPVVWGISATIERFKDAMAGIEERTAHPPVTVDLAKIQKAGLIKDLIELDDAADRTLISTTLLRDAVSAAKRFDGLWADYAQAEGGSPVKPIMVVQVPDKASPTKLNDLVSVIDEEWPALAPDAMAHVFGEHTPITVAGRTIPWVPPESIQGSEEIRVVFAKEAISTGWDCPRAEVLYSERPATDATHIAQVIGRMVRQPLARRITDPVELNSVACYLPLFKREALNKVREALEKPGEVGGVAAVVVRPRVCPRNPEVPQEVFDLIESLPSLPTPDSLANPLRRAKLLATALSKSSPSTKAILSDAGAQLTKALHSTLDGLAAEHADAVAENVIDIETADVRRTVLSHTGEVKGTSARQLTTHVRDIERDTAKLINRVREGVGKGYLAQQVAKATTDDDLLDVKVRVAALFMISEVLVDLDAAATKWVQSHLTRFDVDIKNTTGTTKDEYLKIQEQTSELERVGIDLPLDEKVPTQDAKGTAFPIFEHHIFAVKGKYPVKLNDWESAVVQTELVRPSFVAWYRNPSRPIRPALRIAYRDDANEWKSLQVDFLIVSRRDNNELVVSIVDPHGDHLADAKAKLRGLATFAEKYGSEFLRIESISKVKNGKLRSLDLNDPTVRALVVAFTDAEVGALYESADAHDYQ